MAIQEFAIGNAYYRGGITRKERKEKFLSWAEDSGFLLLVEYCCIVEFGHSDIASLTPDHYYQLIEASEPLVFEAMLHSHE